MADDDGYVPNYDERLVPTYVLPEVLRLADGRLADGPELWAERRTELIERFQKHIYGIAPEPPAEPLRSTIVDIAAGALDGQARRVQCRVALTPGEDAPELRLLVYLPARAEGPVPVFLAANFRGNHAVVADPAVELSPAWFPAHQPGVVEHRATEAGRASLSRGWPIERLLEAGVGVATFYYGDVAPDDPVEFRRAARRLFRQNAAAPTPDDESYGAIGLWAWGLSRALDTLLTLPEVDGRRVAVLGHSRLGKAALWAGAQDERFSLVVSIQSGSGGASLFRRRFGQTLDEFARPTSFPYWFPAAFHAFGGREKQLPVDQHQLLALVAPRTLAVGSAVEDGWADPRGEFLAARHASVAWVMLGLTGLGKIGAAEVDQPLYGPVNYLIRSGGHALTTEDWLFALEAFRRSFAR